MLTLDELKVLLADIMIQLRVTEKTRDAEIGKLKAQIAALEETLKGLSQTTT